MQLSVGLCSVAGPTSIIRRATPPRSCTFSFSHNFSSTCTDMQQMRKSGPVCLHLELCSGLSASPDASFCPATTAELAEQTSAAPARPASGLSSRRLVFLRIFWAVLLPVCSKAALGTGFLPENNFYFSSSFIKRLPYTQLWVLPVLIGSFGIWFLTVRDLLTELHSDQTPKQDLVRALCPDVLPWFASTDQQNPRSTKGGKCKELKNTYIIFRCFTYMFSFRTQGVPLNFYFTVFPKAKEAEAEPERTSLLYQFRCRLGHAKDHRKN